MRPAELRSRVLSKFADLRALYPELIKNRPDVAGLVLKARPDLAWAMAVGHLAKKSRDAWTADEWHNYAHALEFHCAKLATDLERTSAALGEAKRKLSRKAKPPARRLASEVLAEQGLSPKLRRGRPENKETWHLAMAALWVKDMAREKGEKLTDRQALAVVYKRRGLREGRAKERTASSVLNEMSRHRKRYPGLFGSQ